MPEDDPKEDAPPEKKPSSPPIWIALLAIGAAILGPRATMPPERLAGAPFEYAPPPDFTPDDSAPPPERPAEVKRVWKYTGSRPTGSPVPAINLVHSANRGTVEPDDMLRVAAEMPASYKADGVEWTLLRSGTRDRPDGARVGFMEASVRQAGASHRVLQLAFPDDTGTSIVSATYPEPAEGAKEISWSDVAFETIPRARGVARRVPGPPSWVYAAWGVGGLAIGLAIRAARARKKPA